jgi:UDP-N-acetylmuramate--alanine ligase
LNHDLILDQASCRFWGDEVQHVHLVGIGGIGLSAIARVLHGAGYTVSGSDAQQTALTAQLAALGMTIYHGHRPEHVTGADLLIVSSAVPRDNPEVVAAQAAGIPVLKRAQVLGEMMGGRYGIAVAGTHGKTTTSACIAFVLSEAGLDPTFIVGGILQDMDTNARLGTGPHLVVEADEYDHTFLGLHPNLAVVTVIEMDHPDCFSNVEEMTAAFERFLHLLPDGGIAIGCVDHRRVGELLRRVRQVRDIELITYGLQAEAMWQAQDVQPNSLGGMDAVVSYQGEPVGKCSLSLPGRHNVSNALAVLAVANCLGMDLEQVLAVLPRFHGVRRRFEVKGQSRGVVVIDDYAHHPSEIKATLAAARRRYGRRTLWVFFQPHTYSRTKALLADFAASFDDADHVLISEIYAAREKDTLGVTARDLVQAMDHPDASEYLRGVLRPGDVLLTLGAGDGYLVGEAVLRELRDREAKGHAAEAQHAALGPPVD